jgi:hypothetical protein
LNLNYLWFILFKIFIFKLNTKSNNFCKLF